MREKERGEREALFIYNKDSERNNTRKRGELSQELCEREIVYSTFIIIYVYRANVVVYEHPTGAVRRGRSGLQI